MDSAPPGPTAPLDAARIDPAAVRALFRSGTVTPTYGWAPGRLQANLLAVPADWAYDVLLFAQRNPKPCPVLDVTDPGSPTTVLAPSADLRTDLPLYQVWRDGELTGEYSDATEHWRGDLVTFLVGCSFTFDAALARAGIPDRYQGRNVAMYVTDRQCRPAGRMRGPLVVSMRPVPAGLVAAARHVTALMPQVHGAPVHIGPPAVLGIEKLDAPDFGTAPVSEPGDVPVFWACGVTLQAAVMASSPPFAITHAPGHMLITDALEADYILDGGGEDE